MPKRALGQTAQPESPGRMVNSKHIVGVSEGARFFNVNSTTFSNWAAQRGSNGMPLPIRVLGSGTFYDLQELLTWWIDWAPSKGAKAGSLDRDLILVMDLEVSE